MAHSAAPTAEVMAITVASRIPDFWPDQPRIWFLRFEAIIAPQKLSSEAKFDLVVSKLSKETITQLAEFISRPPDVERYKTLKLKLVTLYEESATRQMEKLIGEMELGDQKPSQLLTKMRTLAKDKIPDDTLRILWQGHLPATVRAVLTVTDTKDLDQLARMADNVAEVTRIGSVAEVAGSHASVSTVQSPIMAEIAKINARMDNWERSRERQRSTSRHRSQRQRSNSRERPRRRSPSDPDWLCFYHFRFKGRASKCVQPCSWDKQGNEKTRR